MIRSTMQLCGCLVLIATFTWLAGCCANPKPVVNVKPTTPAVALPGPLGPAQQQAPDSLAALIEEHKLQRASFRAFRDALEPYIGTRVSWRLRSWGGENSSVGYDTPGGGRQPVKVKEGEVGRIRFVAPKFKLEDGLGEVLDAGHPIVTCLALFPITDDPLFIRSDSKRAPAAGHGVVVLIEATIWGALREGGGANLWLHDCAVGAVEP
jgi:hypothetical protein